MIISVFDKEENNVGKGENAGYQHFLLFPQCFETASFPDTSKDVIVSEWVRVSFDRLVIFDLPPANSLYLDMYN